MCGLRGSPRRAVAALQARAGGRFAGAWAGEHVKVARRCGCQPCNGWPRRRKSRQATTQRRRGQGMAGMSPLEAILTVCPPCPPACPACASSGLVPSPQGLWCACRGPRRSRGCRPGQSTMCVHAAGPLLAQAAGAAGSGGRKEPPRRLAEPGHRPKACGCRRTSRRSCALQARCHCRPRRPWRPRARAPVPARAFAGLRCPPCRLSCPR